MANNGVKLHVVDEYSTICAPEQCKSAFDLLSVRMNELERKLDVILELQLSTLKELQRDRS
jgi:hypothetical protein